MKPHFHKVPITQENSFSIRHDIEPNFGTLWHYHPYCLGKDFTALPEAYLLPRLFERAKKGLKIKEQSKKKIAALMYQMLDARDLERLVYLISILSVLADATDMETIAPAYGFHQPTSVKEMARLERVFTYVLSNYSKDISLEEVASLASMSVTSFCRYFKGMTHKTFSEFLIEIRISHVCRALVEDRLPTEVICFECGFNNVSNFYRHFKKVTGMTPFEYKKKYLLGYKL
jgi:AraC-like DNA-binding protein